MIDLVLCNDSAFFAYSSSNSICQKPLCRLRVEYHLKPATFSNIVKSWVGESRCKVIDHRKVFVPLRGLRSMVYHFRLRFCILTFCRCVLSILYDILLVFLFIWLYKSNQWKSVIVRIGGALILQRQRSYYWILWFVLLSSFWDFCSFFHWFPYLVNQFPISLCCGFIFILRFERNKFISLDVN